MTIHTNVNGVWKENNTLNVNVGGVWKNVEDVHVNVGGVWKKVFPEYLPIGLIVFSNSSTPVSGWSDYTAANDRMIIGGGGTITTNTSGQVDLTGTLGAAGAHTHTGTVSSSYQNATSTGSYTLSHGLDTRSDGTHTHTANLNLMPASNKVRLIKNNSSTNTKLPANTIMPCVTSLSGLTNVYSDNKFITCGTTIAAVPRTPIYTFGDGGRHGGPTSGGGTHIVLSRTSKMTVGSYPTDNWAEWNAADGEHNSIPTSSVESISESLKSVLLSLWTNASSMFNIASNMIAMWEGTTAPTGWKLCNGSDGTPDLRSCFIRSCAGGSENTTPTGTNTASATVTSITHEFSHTHRGSNYIVGCVRTTEAVSVYNTWSHTHAGFTVTNQAMIPPYYALSFIMKS